jgi:signal peptide peptidase SppA
MKFPHLRAAVCRTPWAIMPDRLEAIAEVIERRVEGYRLSPDEIAAIRGTRPRMGAAVYYDAETLAIVGGIAHLAISGLGAAVEGTALEGGATEISAAIGGSTSAATVIAVINVMGIIAQHAHEVDDISGPGGTSTERVAQSLRSALNDPSVKSIVLNIDSPGGNVYGVQELADEIFKARGSKPIVAQVNSLAASAAYWIAAAADEIVVTPSGEVGSIGVYALHQDVSERAKMEGYKFTFVSAGKYKIEGNSLQPLEDEARAAIQEQVNAYYEDFLKAVARGRGVKVSDVRKGFGEGRVVRAGAAVAEGMADRVATLDETLRRLGAAKSRSGAKAEDEKPEVAAASGDGITITGIVETAEQPAAYDPKSDPRRRRHALRLIGSN